MDEQIMNNEFVEEETNTNFEVIDNNEAMPTTMPEIYVPEPTGEAQSSGPNKALIALAVGGALLVSKPLIKKGKQLAEKHKEKKEARETERIMKVLKKTGLIVDPTEVKPEEVTEVKEADTTTEPVQEAKPEETTEKGGKD